MIVSNFALFSNLLLASGALAVLSSQQGARIARRRENHRSKPVKSVAPSVRAPAAYNNPYWAGAIVLNDTNGYLTSIKGTFTVPNISCPFVGDCGVTIYAGFNGYYDLESNSESCSGAVYAGIRACIHNGQPSYHAWMEYDLLWLSLAHSYDIPSTIPIKPGDVFTASITQAENGTIMALFDDQTTGWSISEPVYMGNICGQDAEWAIGLFDGVDADGLGGTPFANFSTVEFAPAVATDTKGTNHDPLNATLIGAIAVADSDQDGVVRTLVTPGPGSLLIEYV